MFPSGHNYLFGPWLSRELRPFNFEYGVWVPRFGYTVVDNKLFVAGNNVQHPFRHRLYKALIWHNLLHVIHVPDEFTPFKSDFPVSFFAYGHTRIIDEFDEVSKNFCMNLDTHAFNIVLTGFMGTGKSTVGRILAKKLQFSFVDTDVWIEEKNGMSIPDIFSQMGEGAFRKMEQAAAVSLSQDTGQIVSTGGRMMLDLHNVQAFEPNSYIFCLTASAEEIFRRVTSDAEGQERPLLKGENPMHKIVSLLEERTPLYAQFPQIQTESKTPEEIAAEILTNLDAKN